MSVSFRQAGLPDVGRLPRLIEYEFDRQDDGDGTLRNPKIQLFSAELLISKKMKILPFNALKNRFYYL